MLPPSPAHILRGHEAQLNTLSFSTDNQRLYSGDSSGQVTITSTHSLRPLASWEAHTDGILGIQEWNDDNIITFVQGLYYTVF
jgi:ASTRA-associated protein 1